MVWPTTESVVLKVDRVEGGQRQPRALHSVLLQGILKFLSFAGFQNSSFLLSS
jgi:hypothetical protein